MFMSQTLSAHVLHGQVGRQTSLKHLMTHQHLKIDYTLSIQILDGQVGSQVSFDQHTKHTSIPR
jgi:hypothetical protein